MSDEQTERRITLGKIIAYPVGVILILAGLGALVEGSILSWILFIVGGLIALPVVRGQIKDRQGISLSRWATVAVVLVLMVAGGMAMSGSDNGMGPASEPTSGDGGSPPEANGGNSEANLIEGPPGDLLPTVDDFGVGWNQDDEDTTDNETQFYNANSRMVIYRITIHDSVDEAQTDYQSRVQELEDEGIGKEQVNVGDGGVVYQQGRDLVVLEFRERNVVAYVEYLGDSASPNRAVEYGEILHDSMTS